MSLLSGIMSMATPFIVDRIASTLGVNSALARTAISMAAPAIINAFASKAATPSGASALFNAVSSADTSLLNNLEKTLSGAGKDAFMNSSTATMNNLLGNGVVSQLANTIGHQAGLGGSAASMLVPLVGQMTLTGLAKSSAGMDASGLANLLADEHRAATAQGTHTTTHVTGQAAATTASIARPEMPKVEVPKMDIPKAEIPKVNIPKAPTPPPMPASAGGGLMRWIIPLIALLGLGWYFLGGRTMPPVPVAEAPKVEAPAADAMAALNIDGVDVTKSLKDVMGGLTTTFGEVKDATTAQAVLPKIAEYTGMIDKVTGVATKFSPENKTLIGGLISTGLPAVRAAADKALAQQGVGDLLKPAVDGLFAKIEALAK